MTSTASKTPLLLPTLARSRDGRPIVGRAWQVLVTAFDLVFNAPTAVARVQRMRALLEEAERVAPADPVQAGRLRARAAVLAAV